MKKVKNTKAQLLVTPEQYSFLMNYYEKMGICPNILLADKIYWDNGFELVFKGFGIYFEQKDGFEIIDLRDLGNDIREWLYKININSHSNNLISVENHIRDGLSGI